MKTIICKFTNEICHTYSEYLNSDHWKILKAKYGRSKLPKNCGACGAKGCVDMHHKTYKRIGQERLNDLIPLCRDCHEMAHYLADNPNLKNVTIFNAHKYIRRKLKK